MGEAQLKRAILFLCLIFAGCAAGTTITGTVRDTSGSALGSAHIWFTLSQTAAQKSTGGCGGPATLGPGIPSVFATDANGAVVAGSHLVGNDCITPAGTFYQYFAIDINGVTCCRKNVLVNGSTVDVASLPSPTPPTPGGGGGDGTVTSVTAGIGLDGGVITATGTIDLQIPVTVAHGGTGSTTKNFVDLSTGQTVAGAKTFSSVLSAPIRDKGGMVYNVMAYGAVADGTTDDAPAIQAVIDAAPAGSTIYLPRGTYAIGATLTLGNGNSTTLATTGNYTTIRGDAAGDGADVQISTPAGGTILKWIGAAAGIGLIVNGPISHVTVENLAFNANTTNIANGFLRVHHAHDSTFRNLSARKYAGFAYKIDAYVGPISGIVTGANSNLWERVVATEPGSAGSGIQIGNATAVMGSFDVAQNHWINCTFFSGATGYGIELRFTDASSFYQTATAGAGTALLISPPSGATSFPGGITFYNCPLQGSAGTIAGSGWTGTNPIMFLPFPDGDGETIPTQNFAAGVTASGEWFGTFWHRDNAGFGGNANPQAAVHAVSTSSAAIRGVASDQYSTDTNGGRFVGRKARGTQASPTIAVNGDTAMANTGSLYDGSAFLNGGVIRLYADGVVSSGHAPTAFGVYLNDGSSDPLGGAPAFNLSHTGAMTNLGLAYPTSDGSAGDVMTSDGAGHFTMQTPAGGFPPKVDAYSYRGSTQAIADSTDTAITFTADRYVDTLVRSGTQLQIPTGQAGTYLITATVSWATNATGSRLAWILKNGTTNIGQTTVAANGFYTTHQSIAVQGQFADSDYFELWVSQDSGGSVNVGDGQGHTSLQLVRVN